MADELALATDSEVLPETTVAVAEPRSPRDVLEALETGWSKLPREEMLAIRENREIYVPLLIERLQEICNRIRSGETYEGSLPFLALSMLTELKAREALPAVLDLITLPEVGGDALLGDLVTEFLPLALAVLASEQPQLIEPILCQRSVDFYVRWAVAQAFFYWVRDGLVTREAAVETLRKALRVAIDTNDAYMATPCNYELIRYGAVEARADLIEAQEKCLDEFDKIPPEGIDEELASAASRYESELARLEPTKLDDAIDYFSDWSMYNPPDHSVDYERQWTSLLNENRFDDENEEEVVDEYLPPPPSETIVNQSRKVGRNESCPCGSGRKFKKCCGSRH
jgi:hypothetical protein